MLCCVLWSEFFFVTERRESFVCVVFAGEASLQRGQVGFTGLSTDATSDVT